MKKVWKIAREDAWLVTSKSQLLQIPFSLGVVSSSLGPNTTQQRRLFYSRIKFNRDSCPFDHSTNELNWIWNTLCGKIATWKKKRRENKKKKEKKKKEQWEKLLLAQLFRWLAEHSIDFSARQCPRRSFSADKTRQIFLYTRECISLLHVSRIIGDWKIVSYSEPDINDKDTLLTFLEYLSLWQSTFPNFFFFKPYNAKWFKILYNTKFLILFLFLEFTSL